MWFRPPWATGLEMDSVHGPEDQAEGCEFMRRLFQGFAILGEFAFWAAVAVIAIVLVLAILPGCHCPTCGRIAQAESELGSPLP